MMAKHYHFDLIWGDNPKMYVTVNKSIERRLANLLQNLDSDAPAENEIYADGILDWSWRKPPAEDKIVEAIKSLNLDFCYRFVPDGNIHVEKDCENCYYDGPLRYGDICCAVPSFEDWKIVKVSEV